jgi:V-type H+-transporting ATPase 16kDa proteolipid subunit
MAGIIAVYGLVVSVLIAGSRTSHGQTILDPVLIVLQVKPTNYSLFAGFIHLGAGLACGFTGLSAGYAVGYVGDSVSTWVYYNDVY